MLLHSIPPQPVPICLFPRTKASAQPIQFDVRDIEPPATELFSSVKLLLTVVIADVPAAKVPLKFCAIGNIFISAHRFIGKALAEFAVIVLADNEFLVASAHLVTSVFFGQSFLM